MSVNSVRLHPPFLEVLGVGRVADLDTSTFCTLFLLGFCYSSSRPGINDSTEGLRDVKHAKTVSTKLRQYGLLVI
jgi:hypothetical protein